MTPWPGAEALSGGARAHTGIAVLDVDNDRDLDLVLTADKSAPVALLNDRLGSFREVPIEGIAAAGNVSGILATNFDADGRTDLVAAARSGPAQAWRNVTELAAVEKTKIKFEPWPINASGWSAAQAIDLDLDGRTDLLGLPAAASKPGEIALAGVGQKRREAVRGRDASTASRGAGSRGITAVDLVGDPLPDVLILRPGEKPALARNSGNGNHWLAIRLGGYWRVKPELMRTNSHGIGTRITLEGQGLFVPYDYTTPDSGLGQSIAPFVLGLGATRAGRPGSSAVARRRDAV